ncbi:MAG: methyltransferase domain-containing protein [Cyclobacteriaceae bacterium]
MNRFKQRSLQKEWMDDLQCGGKELDQTLRELKTINRWLGGNSVTTNGLNRLLKQQNQWPVTVADLGCGGGDMIAHMMQWATEKQYSINFIGIDANPNIIALAREKFNAHKNQVKFTVGDVFEENLFPEPVDISTCTLFTHHFSDQELVLIINNLNNNAKLGLVINDLHRHPLAYHSIKLLTGWFSRSSMVKNDAPLSVLRAFNKKDWQIILKRCGINKFEISWHWAFRWQVICWK